MPVSGMSGSRRLVAAAIAVFVLLGFAIDWWRRRAVQPAQSAPEAVATGPGLAIEPALSADGRWLAYASTGRGRVLDLWIQPASGGEPRRLTSAGADCHSPTFSPDGTRVAFRSEQGEAGVYVMPAAGGSAVPVLPGGRDPRFSPDGKSLACWMRTTEGQDQVLVVPASGGAPRRVCTECVTARHPVWSPDGRHLLIFGNDGRRRDLYTVPASGGSPAHTGAIGVMGVQGVQPDSVVPLAWTGRHVLLSARVSGRVNIWRVSIDPRLLQVTTGAEQLSAGRGYEASAASAGSTLVYSSTTSEPAAYVLPLDARSGTAAGEPQRAAAGAGARMTPSISANGSRIAFRRGDRLWVRDLAAGAESPLAIPNLRDSPGLLSPDGARVAYSSEGNLYVTAASGGGDAKLLGQRTGQPWSWSADGTRLLCQSWRRSLVLLYPATGQRFDIARHPDGNIYEGRFSPDARWIALSSGLRGGGRRVWIVPFREAIEIPEADWIPVTSETGMNRYPCWSADGLVLYYLSERDGFRCIWAQRLGPAGHRPDGEPFAIRHFHTRMVTLMNPADTSDTALASARGKLIFTVFESSGSLWRLRLSR